MHDLILNSLFRKNADEYSSIEKETKSFLSNYAANQSNIKDDIFATIKNYDEKVNFLLYPIEDPEVCGFICNYKGKIFIYVNTFLPIEKQIFTAAHELYHLIYNKEQLEEDFNQLIKSKNLEEKEEKKANAFAALLLVPTAALDNLIRILKIKRNNVKLIDVIKLMDFFAVPFKTIVLRLYEIDYITDNQADKLLQIPDRDTDDGILYEINKHGIGEKWQNNNCNINYGDLKALIIDNDEEELISKSKAIKDLDYINKDIKLIYKELGEQYE